jgi:hypothetical protein
MGFSPQYAQARAGASWGLGMMSKDRIEQMIAARLAEHDDRVRVRRAGKLVRSAKWHAVMVARERASEERARLRELRNKPCGARTRAGHPCRRQGLGKGGRCPNHGGMSTGPRTPEGRARISASLAARWAARRAAAATEPKGRGDR